MLVPLLAQISFTIKRAFCSSVWYSKLHPAVSVSFIQATGSEGTAGALVSIGSPQKLGVASEEAEPREVPMGVSLAATAFRSEIAGCSAATVT